MNRHPFQSECRRLIPPRGRAALAGFAWAALCAAALGAAEIPSAIVAHTNLDLGAPAAPAAARPAETNAKAAYGLGVGDVLSISIYGEEGSARTVPVDPSGHIAYALVGSVPAAGRTVDALRADLQARIDRELKNGIVCVVPVHFGSQTFAVLGLVRNPGTYPLEGSMRVLDAIGRAGGFRSGYFRNSTADLFDLQHALLLRGGATVPVDFDALVSRGDASQNVELAAGDILSIPSALVRSVYVLGEVNYPRTIGFVTSLSLVQALTEARGLKATSNRRLVVVRGSLTKPEAIVVDVDKVMAGKARDLQLCPGDIVYAPRPSLELLTEIVKTAINSFAGTVASSSGAETYRDLRGDPGASTQPIVVP